MKKRRRPAPPPSRFPVNARWIGGGLLLIALIGWGTYRARVHPPVEFIVMTGDPGPLDDGQWDHFETLSVPRNVSRADLERLLTWLREKYAASEFNRVKVVVFNDQYALINANDSAIVATYTQDREKSQFEPQIVAE
ncbi:MAG: hypothetical protein ABI743_08905 [bacterium]